MKTKTRVFTVSSLLFSLALLLALLFTLAAAAQGPDWPVGPQRGGPQPQPIPFQDWEGGKPFPRPDGFAETRQVSTLAAALGEPGLSFRYVGTFGETEVAYYPDTSHLNYPYGIGTVGNYVWIGEKWGNRILKYDSAGAFQVQFGRARFPSSEFQPIVEQAGV